MPTSTTLSPAQQVALDALIDTARPGRLVVLGSEPGMGKTTVIEAARARLGGTMIRAESLQEAAMHHHPLALEDAIYETVRAALAGHEIVFVDDMVYAMAFLYGCNAYPRGGYLNMAISALGD